VSAPADIGVVVLTMGTRPAELRAALDSVLAQRDVELDVVCVGNGWEPTGLPAGVRALALPENRGIPAGRNAGVPEVKGELLFFLDDDARLDEPGTLAVLAERFAGDRRLGLVQPRVDDPDGRPAPGRWVPRVRAGDHTEPGPATSLWEGAVMIRRSVFDAAGGWPAPFFYAHEGIELCWRTWDSGHTAWYAGDVRVLHPVIDPLRHAEFWRLNARNRVWLARRNLPVPFLLLYPLAWALLTTARVRDLTALRSWWGGFVAGWRESPGERRVVRWRTVWALTRAGRPPVL
jgi:GT2 family glycosyltransferase